MSQSSYRPPGCQYVAMTSIVAWAGVDARGVSSIYIASDSRVSWTNNPPWNQGRKTFASDREPCILGYWGDVLFPSLALPVLIDKIDNGLLDIDPSRPFGELGSSLRRLWIDYPGKQRRDMGIILGGRVGSKMRSRFQLAVMTYSATTANWSFKNVPMPASSSVLRVAGSGASQVRSARRLWEESAQSGTSRAVFSAFCEALEAGSDRFTGGGPQLVGIRRIGAGLTFGLIHKRRRYFNGSRLRKSEAVNSDVEWFNDLFERVDPLTMKRMRNAQVHFPR